MATFLEVLNRLPLGREKYIIETFYREVVFAKRALTVEELSASISWIGAMAFKSLAAKETQSSSIKFILGKMKLHVGREVTVTIPHYWAMFYHDGPGPKIPRFKKFFLIFPKGQDPRRPKRAFQEQDPKSVKGLMDLGPDALKNLKKKFGKEMKFFRVRRAWKGDPFFDRTEEKWGDDIGDLCEAFYSTLMAIWIDGLFEKTYTGRIYFRQKTEMLYMFWKAAYHKGPSTVSREIGRMGP